jgi:hypothetical protein
MKKYTFIFLFVFAIILFSCSLEKIDENAIKNTDLETNSQITVDLDNLGEECLFVNLIAGQHHDAGSVTVYNDGENLIIIYATNGDWTIDLTHLSVGNCNEDWVPLTGSGNPKIGQFEYTEPYSSSDNEVVYVIPLIDLNENYCFAAHAEVQGPTGGETAWAEGTGFEGNSWAMFVEGLLSDCDNGDDSDDEEPPT